MDGVALDPDLGDRSLREPVPLLGPAADSGECPADRRRARPPRQRSSRRGSRAVPGTASSRSLRMSIRRPVIATGHACGRSDRSCPLGNRFWRRGVWFSGSFHERSFLKRTDQEPPLRFSLAGADPLALAGVAAVLPRRLARAGGVVEAALRIVRSSRSDSRERRSHPLETAPATGSEPLGRSLPGPHRFHPWSRSTFGPSVAAAKT